MEKNISIMSQAFNRKFRRLISLLTNLQLVKLGQKEYICVSGFLKN